MTGSVASISEVEAAAASFSPPGAKAKRQLGARACDRCRRRKCKCNLPPSGSCEQCRAARANCTFDLPTARRGPKARKKPAGEGAAPKFSEVSLLGFGSPPPPPPPPANSSLTFGAPTTENTPWRSAADAADAIAIDSSLLPHAIPEDTLRRPNQDGSSALSAVQRWSSLVSEVTARNHDFDTVLNQCVELFFRYLYPLTPLVHEPSFRDSLAYFVPSRRSTPRRLLEKSPDAAFTLITAVCAEAAFLLPRDMFPPGEAVADAFLQASRACLAAYLEADLESPDASSIAIRYFHSNCVHAAGKPKFSWHIFGEATRLAQVMRLHDEASYEGLYPVEAEMRRRAFWIVYMGDKSAAILNNRPITMHKYSFECGVTAAYPAGVEGEGEGDRGGEEEEEEQGEASQPPPISPNSVRSRSEPTATRRQKLILGFNANIRLWGAASDLLLALRVMQDQAGNTGDDGMLPALSPMQREIIDPLYIAFITSLDNLPPFLKPHSFTTTAESETSQSSQFLIQCANLQVSMHCLRMVIVQKFEHLSYLTAGVEQTDLQKTEIVRDVLRVIHEVPFWALQVNGEPYVEKIRLIGATLMAIIHRNPNSPIAARARGDFGVLLDVLTRLDSKASDALRSNSSWIL